MAKTAASAVSSKMAKHITAAYQLLIILERDILSGMPALISLNMPLR